MWASHEYECEPGQECLLICAVENMNFLLSAVRFRR